MPEPSHFSAINPATNEILDGLFAVATAASIDEAAKNAAEAFKSYRKQSKDQIATFLEKAADEILNLGDELIDRCHQETALPIPRLQGERGRTVNQLKLFASLVREGSWVDARIDTALPDRSPIPKPDIRYMLKPLGPVAVFGASNFPLAFSVAGGDTVSALAAGCPVVCKGHPAHPGTSELVAGAIIKAAQESGMPDGTFSLVQGNTNAVGQYLIQNPNIKAVGFTGSFRGGKALFDLASQRPEPIPVFAEMGSSNPVFILPGILKEKGDEIATNLAASITLGVGQFCTNPGLAFVQKSPTTEAFTQKLASCIATAPAGTMLTAGIKKAYDAGITDAQKLEGVETLISGMPETATNASQAKVFKTSIETYSSHPQLSEENFGPSHVLVEAESKDQILRAAKELVGHLTATVMGTEKDFAEYQELFDILETKVGRVVVNGYPTGVEVCPSMVHGGPYPATTAPQSTSVGTGAITRFARPVCFQNYPDALLPDALKNANPGKIWRLLNGDLSKETIS